MSVEHHVPASRLTRQYFRRWWFWKGFSRCRLERRHPVTELGIDLSRVPKVGGVPRFMFGAAARDVLGWVRALMAQDSGEGARREMMLWYFAGYVRAARAEATLASATICSATPQKQ